MSKTQYLHGRHSIEEALSSGKPIQRVWFKKGRAAKERSLITKLSSLQVPFSEVPLQAFRKTGARAEDAMAAETAPVEYHRCSEMVQQLFEQGITPRIAVLDGITDVRNFGAIARSALAFGFHTLVIPAHKSAMVTADALKTSAGALNHIPVCRELNFKKSIQDLAWQGLTLTACTEKVQKQLYDTDLTGPSAIVLGSEEQGISKEIRALCHQEAQIPLTGPLNSLNVSVAAGIAFYEVTRQG